MQKEEFLKKLGLQIKKLRESKNLSQRQLGYIIDKEQKSINRLENGQTNPSIYFLSEVAKGLEVSLADLVNF